MIPCTRNHLLQGLQFRNAFTHAFDDVSHVRGDSCSRIFGMPKRLRDNNPVARVVDGDTFHSDVGRVRLYGMDTPDSG